MTPYEQYLLNDFKPYTIQNNPFEAGSDRTRIAPNWDTSRVIQGELANKPKYDARGQRYGSTLSDDMFDIKNKRVGNYTDESKPMSKHPWIDDYTDYSMPQILPTLKPTDYSTAPVEESVSPIEQYLENNPYLTRQDVRDRVISRKKNVGEGIGLQIPEDGLSDANYGYETDMFEDPDYAQYLADMDYLNMLKSQISTLSTDGDYYDPGIREDMKYIKNNGNTMHWTGDQAPRYDAEYDYEAGVYLNPERLSPATAELIARGTLQDRPEQVDVWGEKTGLSPLINSYRRKLGMTPHTPSGGAYMQGVR